MLRNENSIISKTFKSHQFYLQVYHLEFIFLNALIYKPVKKREKKGKKQPLPGFNSRGVLMILSCTKINKRGD